jgi:hypothetical protein
MCSAFDLHQHDHIRVPTTYVDPRGRPVDHELLGRLVSALLDDCDLCSELMLVLLAEDAVSTARLIELAYLSGRRHDADPLADDSSTRPLLSPRLLAVFVAGVTQGSAALLTECERMSPSHRQTIAGDAAAVMIHQLTTGL